MLDSIRLQQFRSYSDDSFEFANGVNIIVGPNASGKTNLLEAILVASRGASYRARDVGMVQLGTTWGRIDADGPTGPRIVKLEWQNDAVKKTFEIGGQQYQRLSLPKTLPTVVFEPNHLLLLIGSPELRRAYLDDLIEQTTPGYGTVRRAYRRVLSQRNALLKKGYSVAKSQIFVWDLRLSELGGKIASERMKLTEHINEQATTIYQSLSNTKASVAVSYQPSCDPQQYETSLLKHLESSLERDCLLGFTNVGPHRDDIKIVLNDQSADDTASRGETRSLVLMLKLIELEQLERVRGLTPLLLLDDVFSELDGARRHALTSHLEKYQTFITTTDADIVLKNFAASTNVIPLGHAEPKPTKRRSKTS